MKKVAFVWMLTAMLMGSLALATASADDAKPKKDRAAKKQKVEKQREAGGMFKGLDLTTDQQKQIKAIQAETKAEMKTIKEKHGDDKKAARAATKELQTKQKERLMAVLTEQQEAKLKELIAQRKEAAAKKRAEAKKNKADKPKDNAAKPKKEKKAKKADKEAA